jgi:hypothetical protein
MTTLLQQPREALLVRTQESLACMAFVVVKWPTVLILPDFRIQEQLAPTSAILKKYLMH